MAFPGARSKSNQRRDGVFISYARSDGEAFARRLRELLEPEGLALWRDREAMEGGDDWWLQITEALDEVQLMALVVTSNALKSEVVRKEWRYARQQGVCVYPIQASPDLDFGSLPRWMRDQHFYNLGFGAELGTGPNWKKFLNDLHTTPEVRRVPFIPYDRPERFVERPGEFERLVALLYDEKREEPIAITAALRGASGYGKTTIAMALCHDQRIQDAFDDGIVWVTLGQTPDLTALLADLIETLSGDRPGFTGQEAATVRLKELLADRDLLMVVDDVWNRDHLRPFLRGGPRCARLVTTRNLDTLPEGAAQVNVGAMQPAEAVMMLRAGLPDAPADTFEKLAARLGKWPLLLGLVNGRPRERTEAGEALAHALAFVNEALDEEGVTAFDDSTDENRNRAVAVTLGLSFRLLGESELARFHELAIFPEDARIPLATVERLWRQTGGLSRVKSDELYRRFFNLSLLSDLDRQAGVMQLHDAVWTYLNDGQRGHLAATHSQLLDAHRPPAGWAELPDAEPYLWDHLAGHLAEAGLSEELVATVKDWRYLAKKTLLKKSLSVERDLLRAEALAPAGDPLRTLRRGISVSSHLISHCDNRRDIESTLLARLHHLTDLTAMLQDLAQNLGRPYVTPQSGLPDLPHPALIRTLEGHSDSVSGCAFSPDGKLIVSASNDNTLRVWDAETGQMLRSLVGHSDSVNGCAFSPDGKLIVSASDDDTLKVWDAETGQMLRSLDGHSASVNGCAFSPDGKLIVSASDDSTLIVWDAETGQMPRSLAGHSASLNGCAFSPDGKLIVSASDDCTLKVWDAETGQMLRALDGHSASVNGCAFSPDGKLIVSASDDSTLIVWDAETGQMPRSLAGHSASLNGCAFSPDGKLIVSASDDCTLKVWDAETGQMLRALDGHSASVNGCAFSPDGKLIASASDDNMLKVWRAETGQMLRSLIGHSSSPSGCAFSPDGKLIVSSSGDNMLKVWDAETGQMLRSLVGHFDSVNGCAFSLDGKLIVSASDDRTLKVWDAETGQMPRSLVGHSYSVNGCAFSPDGKLIVSASGDNMLKVWDAETGHMLRSLVGHSSWVMGCAFSPDGKLIVSASDDSTLKVWDTETGQLLRSIVGHSSWVMGCAFSPDGKLIVSAHRDSTLKVWNVETSQMLRTLEGHSDYVMGCAFSPDVKLIVSASGDNMLKVWDAETGHMSRSFVGHSDSVNGCAFSPDGKLIVSASDDCTLKIWDAETGQMLRSLDGHSDSVDGCVFSPDGKLIVSASEDRTLKVWEATTGIYSATFYADGPISCCAFSNDNALIVAGGARGVYFLRLVR